MIRANRTMVISFHDAINSCLTKWKGTTMRKPSIHELREREIRRLIKRNPSVTERDARRLMTSFYRLCALSWQNLELGNDERTCNTKWFKRQEEREMRWYDRLNAEFNKAYALNLKYCGCMPAIGVIDKGSGGFTEIVERFFYD